MQEVDNLDSTTIEHGCKTHNKSLGSIPWNYS